MLKTLACLFVVAAVSNAAVVKSGSTNTGMNLMSSNSQVVQSGVQNVNDGQDGYGYGLGFGRGYYGGLDYLGHHGLAGYHPGYYGYGGGAYGHHLAGYGHGYHGGYGGFGAAAAAGYGYPGVHGYPGGYYGLGLDHDIVNSKSTNTAMNVMSKNSDVAQHNVQNVNKMKY